MASITNPLYPVLSIALTSKLRASSAFDISGAKPPSSPTAVCDFPYSSAIISFRVQYISDVALILLLTPGIVGIIINS